MDEIAFHKKMREVDDSLASQKVAALWRPMLAWLKITGLNEFRPSPRNAAYSVFEGPNLFHEIEAWYGRHYPYHATFHTDWGNRWFVMRGEFYRAKIPLVFNPAEALDPFEHMSEVPDTMLQLLSINEKNQIRNDFNAFFWQASDINLNLTVWRSKSPGPVIDFIERGWADLRDAGTAFRPNDPTSVLFTIQQAAEKYLKALLLTFEPAVSADDLRKQYGHNVCKLLNACLTFCTGLARLESHIHLFDYSPNVRYERPDFSASEVVVRLNLSYAICHASAKSLLSFRKDNHGRASE